MRPNRLTIIKATRRCAPLLAIAADKINPPSKSKIKGFP
ncbi:hypothetical protein imdm_2144 [gamma proteobacterium IMCC2047]|nr:hypothetical protein imdm_2144 [gamma proteobacterium IMCC2047]